MKSAAARLESSLEYYVGSDGNTFQTKKWVSLIGMKNDDSVNIHSSP